MIINYEILVTNISILFSDIYYLSFIYQIINFSHKTMQLTVLKKCIAKSNIFTGQRKPLKLAASSPN